LKHIACTAACLACCLQYKKEAPRVEALLSRKGWKAAAIHGDISQAQRTAAVEAFKAGTCPLLIATDVAARGLDIPDVEVVINYSFPLTIEDYVHRIGRTGRAGKTGTAVTFFVGNNDKQRAGELRLRQQAGMCAARTYASRILQHISSGLLQYVAARM
jgi:superfamily II DNA/RNA helicase